MESHRSCVTSIANLYVNFSWLSFVSLCSCSLALCPQNLKLSPQSISFVETIISSALYSFSSNRYHLDFFLLQPIASVNLKTTACIFNSPCNSYHGWLKKFSAEILFAKKEKSSLLGICTFSFCQTLQKNLSLKECNFQISQDIFL